MSVYLWLRQAVIAEVLGKQRGEELATLIPLILNRLADSEWITRQAANDVLSAAADTADVETGATHTLPC